MPRFPIIHMSLAGKIIFLAVSIIIVPFALVYLGPYLGYRISFIALIPLFIGAYGFGIWGGTLTGSLGLPYMWLIFILSRQPQLIPTYPFLIQISFMITGIGLGFNSSYLHRLTGEIENREERERELEEALKDKELLFKELNHRVKNNLNLVKSLIQLQIYRTDDEIFEKEGEKLINRILSISLVHEQLYSGQLGDQIELRGYLDRLIKHIIESQTDGEVTRQFHSNIAYCAISLDKAISLGIIVNEILTNSLKYAFDADWKGSREISLDLKEVRGDITLCICDKGKGLSDDNKEGLGMTLVSSLTDQLGGEYKYLPVPRGTSFSMTFPRETIHQTP